MPPSTGCKALVAASCTERSELDTGACRVEAEAVTGLEVVAGVPACCNGCTSVQVPTLNDLCEGFVNKKASAEKT